MKKYTLLFSLLIGLFAFGQVSIPVDSITVGGIAFRATATFECMVWNNRTQTVSVQWLLEVHGRDSSIVVTKAIEQIADNSTYVYQDGAICTDSTYFDSTQNKYICGGITVMKEYDFYQLIAEHGLGGASINQLIRMAGLRRKSIFKL